VKLGVLAGVLALSLAGCSSGEKRSAPAPKAAKPARQARAPSKPHIVHPHNRAVPILMYHVVGTPPAGAPFPGLYVRRADFAAQLAWLRAHGYHAVSLRRVYDYWRRGFALPQRPVVLTFDDGYREDFTNVRPLLAQRHWPGVLNLAVENLLDRKLTVPQIRTLIRNGWELDAHTLTHRDLTALAPADLRHIFPLLDGHVSFVDPPDHTRIRRVLGEPFKPRQMAALAGWIGTTVWPAASSRSADGYRKSASWRTTA